VENSGSALQYPAPFREARIEVRVTGDFVVDSAGYADAETFRVLSGHDAVFEKKCVAPSGVYGTNRSVASLHPVPQLVQQTFIFSLTR
jgi:hypothetical protein